MKKLNILFGLFIALMIMLSIECSNDDNPIKPQPVEHRVIYYAEINDTMRFLLDPGFIIDTLYGDFDFTRSDSIKIEFTYLTNTDWGCLCLDKRVGINYFNYCVPNEPESPSISDSAYHTASKAFKSNNQRFDSMQFIFFIYFVDYVLRYTILKDIKITEM